MKVVVVNPSLFTSFYDYHLCRALVATGAGVTMVSRPPRSYEKRNDEPFTFADLFYRGTAQREVGWRTSKLGRILKGFEHAAGLRALEQLVIEQRADIVHFQWLVLPFLDGLTLQRLRRHSGLVLTVHNADVAAHNAGAIVGRIGAALQGAGLERALTAFDRYVVHSGKALENLLRRGIAREKIVHLAHPPLELEDSHTPQPPPIDDTKHNVLFFGQIKPYKGADILVDAGIKMAASRRDFRITIAGRPFQSMNEIRARIARAGAEDVFHFDLDFIPDPKLAGYLSAASVVVFPYLEIDGSGALSHAVRFEKPIVASKVGGFDEPPFRDYIEHVPPGDASTLANTLTELLDDPARLEDVRRRTIALGKLLPTWNDYALACRDAYLEIAPR